MRDIKNYFRKAWHTILFNRQEQPEFDWVSECKKTVKSQCPELEELIKNNTELKGIHAGERCFILGNGPSLNKVDLSLLRDEYTFTVNQISRREDFCKMNTTYHLWSDERFFDLDSSRPEDMELLDVMRAVKTQKNAPIVFYKGSARNMIERFRLDKELNIRYYFDGNYSVSQEVQEITFDDVIPRFPTVVHYAIVLAVYMGFKNIYLLGCDCSGILNTINQKLDDYSDIKYTYEISENEKKRLERIKNQSTLKDELRWYADLFDTYDLLDQYCLDHGTKLFNATDGGLLETIKRVKLEEVLK